MQNTKFSLKLSCGLLISASTIGTSNHHYCKRTDKY